ncbi:MAG TPA: PH domain-containing protein [Planctomycetota bacterium]|nr:PH domain-containing protein [Planctomycetota bacterium]
MSGGEMETKFKASRWTRGNFLFPTLVEVRGDTLVLRKRNWWKVDEKTMHLSRVASVDIQKGLLFADLRIESSGGGDDIVSHGHWKRDAESVQRLIQEWQSRNLPPGQPQVRP